VCPQILAGTMAAEEKATEETELKRAERLALGERKYDVRRMHHVNAFRYISADDLYNKDNVRVMKAYVTEFGNEFHSHRSRNNAKALHKFLKPRPINLDDTMMTLGLNSFYNLYNKAYPKARVPELIESFNRCSLKKEKED